MKKRDSETRFKLLISNLIWLENMIILNLCGQWSWIYDNFAKQFIIKWKHSQDTRCKCVKFNLKKVNMFFSYLKDRKRLSFFNLQLPQAGDEMLKNHPVCPTLVWKKASFWKSIFDLLICIRDWPWCLYLICGQLIIITNLHCAINYWGSKDGLEISNFQNNNLIQLKNIGIYFWKSTSIFSSPPTGKLAQHQT